MAQTKAKGFRPTKRRASRIEKTKAESICETIKIPEAARIAGCGQRAIRNEIEKGSMPHLRWGRNIVLPRAAFLRWIDAAANENVMPRSARSK
jgi:excisionase family DNA binding protein